MKDKPISIEDKKKVWSRALKRAGHTPALVDGELDIFFHEDDIHNGPGCSACAWSACWHCDTVETIPPKCSHKKGA